MRLNMFRIFSIEEDGNKLIIGNSDFIVENNQRERELELYEEVNEEYDSDNGTTQLTS